MPQHDEPTAHEHEHGPPAAPTEPPPAAVTETGPPLGGLALRVGLTLLGATGLIVGAFLKWFDSQGVSADGVDFEIEIFWSSDVEGQASFFESAGFVAVIIGLLSLLGMALRNGLITRIAGALGVVAFVLFTITIYRVPDQSFGISDLGLGIWLVLAGAVVTLVAGFVGSGTRTTTSPVAPPPPA